MVISNMSLFLKYFICIDAIALDYRVNLLVLYLLHWRNSQNLLNLQQRRRSDEHARDGKGRMREPQGTQGLATELFRQGL